MKVCPKCNLRYSDEERFCKRCGTPLEHGEYYEEEAPKRNKTLIIALAAGAIVLILASVSLIGMFQSNKREQEVRQAEAAAAEAEANAAIAQAEADAEAAAAQAAAQQAAAEAAAAQQATAEAQAREAQAQAAAQQAAAEEEAARQAQIDSLGEKWDRLLDEAEVEDHFIARSNQGGFDNEMYTEQARYDLWDGLLNDLWQDLKSVLTESQIDTLRVEQQEWISQKETMIADFWDDYNVDYSGYPDAPASVITKSRVYYLRNYIPDEER